MTTQPTGQQRQSITKTLKELQSPKHSPGATPPRAAAFTDAHAFLEQMPLTLREIPHISLADDGELNFAWNGGPIHIDLGFYGTGTYSYFARDHQGQEHHGDHISPSGPIPNSLGQMLTG